MDFLRIGLFLLLGIAIGMAVGGILEHKMDVNAHISLTEQIVLTIPKTQQEAEKQLLYMAASKGMLEEIHRQKILRRQ